MDLDWRGVYKRGGMLFGSVLPARPSWIASADGSSSVAVARRCVAWHRDVLQQQTITIRRNTHTHWAVELFLLLEILLFFSSCVIVCVSLSLSMWMFMCIQVLRILSLSLNLNTSKFPIFLNSFTIIRFLGLIGISSHAFVERKRGGSGWMMPEGFHQLLRRSFVVDISLFSVVFLLQLFFLLHIQAFETSAALEVFSVNFNASVPEVFSPDGEISKVIVSLPNKGNEG